MSVKLRRVRGSYLACVLVGAVLAYEGMMEILQPWRWVVVLGGWFLAYGLRGLFSKSDHDF